MAIASKENNPYPFRMTSEMRSRLEAAAKSSGRSLQKEMIQRLDLTLEIEAWLSKDVSSLDGILPYILQLLKDSISNESRIEQLHAQIDNLKSLNKKLSESVRIDDRERISLIRRQALTIHAAVTEIIKNAPPSNEPALPPLAPHNPSKIPENDNLDDIFKKLDKE
ncbi:Arc family DNA-binding protein [Yersinia canariae]|uniref:Arc family DNA-binding protein n=1 Tax=Yersinia canariae TaxID=2607663 RepID=UPI0015F2E33A|nr:Arc family DNA-binding protein [Yersinia canariae]